MRKIKTNVKKKKNVKKNETIENEISLKKIGYIVGVIAIIFIVFYLLTAVILDKEKHKKRDYSNYTLIESSKNILMSDAYNQSDEKYYVLAVMDDYDDMYSLYLGKKSNVYYVNLDNALNKTIISKETVIDSDARNIKISDTTLLVVENNKLVEYHTGYDDVIAYLREI